MRTACLPIFEACTFSCAENQAFLLQDKALFLALLKDLGVQRQRGSTAIVSLLAVLKVLVNLSNDSREAEVLALQTASDSSSGFNVFSDLLQCILADAFSAAEDAAVFDVRVNSLGTLINLIEHSPENRDYLREVSNPMDGHEVSAVIILVRLFSHLFSSTTTTEVIGSFLESQPNSRESNAVTRLSLMC